MSGPPKGKMSPSISPTFPTPSAEQTSCSWAWSDSSRAMPQSRSTAWEITLPWMLLHSLRKFCASAPLQKESIPWITPSSWAARSSIVPRRSARSWAKDSPCSVSIP